MFKVLVLSLVVLAAYQNVLPKVTDFLFPPDVEVMSEWDRYILKMGVICIAGRFDYSIAFPDAGPTCKYEI